MEGEFQPTRPQAALRVLRYYKRQETFMLPGQGNLKPGSLAGNGG